MLPQIQGNPLFKVSVTVPVWINIAAPAGMLALTGLAALVPAVRAGYGHAAHRLAGRLPLPRPVTAGLAAPFTRPARSAATLATITIGLSAAVLAAGLSSQITHLVLSIGIAYIDRPLFERLTWLVVVLAGIGVFSTLLTQARERVHDLGVHKALGMTPRQVITMVTCWAVAPAIIAAAIALPVGIVLEPLVARAVVSAQAGPAEDINPLVSGASSGPGAPATRRPPESGKCSRAERAIPQGNAVRPAFPGSAGSLLWRVRRRRPGPLHPRRTHPARPGRTRYRSGRRARASRLGRRVADYYRTAHRVTPGKATGTSPSP